MDKLDMMGRLVSCGGTAPINGSQKNHQHATNLVNW